MVTGNLKFLSTSVAHSLARSLSIRLLRTEQMNAGATIGRKKFHAGERMAEYDAAAEVLPRPPRSPAG